MANSLDELRKELQSLKDENVKLRRTYEDILNNLDIENLSPTCVQDINKPVYAKIEDTDGNVSELQLTASGLSTRMSTTEGNVSTLSLTASGLSTRMSNAEGSITSLSLTASGLSTRISNAEGSITSLSLTVNGLQISTTNGESTSVLSLKAGSTTLSSAMIGFTGMVTFSSMNSALSGYGTTTINGANITTGNIMASLIGANDQFGAIKFNSPINMINGGIIFDSWASLALSGTSLSISAATGIYLNTDTISFSCPNGLYVNGTRIA